MYDERSKPAFDSYNIFVMNFNLIAKLYVIFSLYFFIDRIHLEIAEQIIQEGLKVDIWDNNAQQHWAIKTSLKKRFKLIQGPPGMPC